MKDVITKDLQKDNKAGFERLPACIYCHYYNPPVTSSSEAYREPCCVGKTSRYDPTDVESLEVTGVDAPSFRILNLNNIAPSVRVAKRIENRVT